MTITKDVSVSFPEAWSWRAAQGGPSVGPGDYTGSVKATVVCQRYRTGQALPQWRRKLKEGQNCTTPLTAVWESISCSPASVRYDLLYPDGSWATREGQGRLCFADGRKPALSSVADADITAADNRARAMFYKKLRETQVQFSGPTFLGELRETLRMIKRPASALRDSLDNYYAALAKWKKNRPNGKGSAAYRRKIFREQLERAAGGLWLENAFGLQPLLQDIAAGVKAYERLTPPLVNSRPITGWGTDMVDRRKALQDQDLIPQDKNIGGIVFDTLVPLARAQVLVKYRGQVTVSTDRTEWDNAALFGFTPSEFVPTAWELLPWSFLIDYFTNIGDILTSAVTRASSVRFVNRSIVKEADLHLSLAPDTEKTRRSLGSSWAISGGGDPSHFQGYRKTVTRDSAGGVPLPVFQLESGLSIGQMCNITALLTNFVGLHPQSPPRRVYHR